MDQRRCAGTAPASGLHCQRKPLYPFLEYKQLPNFLPSLTTLTHKMYSRNPASNCSQRQNQPVNSYPTPLKYFPVVVECKKSKPIDNRLYLPHFLICISIYSCLHTHLLKGSAWIWQVHNSNAMLYSKCWNQYYKVKNQNQEQIL